MKIVQTNRFEKTYKKLHKNQLVDANKAIRTIMDNPMIGEQKRGDLNKIRIYKFKMVNQLTLIAYRYEKHEIILTLIAIDSHENFYRDIKRC
jgi:mRNA interferase RelE/StbE